MSNLKSVIEVLLLASECPLSEKKITDILEVEQHAVRQLLSELQNDCRQRGVELIEVASGYRFQVRKAMAPWIQKMTEEKPPRYSRALLETLALIAYRQPVTRGEIELVRGVKVSSNLLNTMQDRGWVCILGHKESPGRPAMYGTTPEFLDYFNLKSLTNLPELPDPEVIRLSVNDPVVLTTES
jgi:segregation and condensation protein B